MSDPGDQGVHGSDNLGPLFGEIAAGAEAAKVVHENTDDGWKVRADAALDRACLENPRVISDDVWEILGDDDMPHDGRAMGQVMKRGAKRGVCAHTGTHRKSARLNCHGHPRGVWRSLTYTGPDRVKAQYVIRRAWFRHAGQTLDRKVQKHDVHASRIYTDRAEADRDAGHLNGTHDVSRFEVFELGPARG